MKIQNTLTRDLISQTQNKSFPSQRDVQPMKRPSRPAVHTFEVTVDRGFVSATNTVTTGALGFRLSDTPSPTDFTALFDQYRIAQVRVEFIPLVTPFGPSTTSIALPYLLTAIDYDDETAVTTSTLQQYGTCMTVANQEYHQRTLNPLGAQEIYTNGVVSGYSSLKPGDWIDSNSPGAAYFGLKWATTPVTVVSGSYDLFAIVAHYTIQCRSNI